MSQLVEHLKMKHELPYIIESVSFDNIEDFQKWKLRVERETSSLYVQHTDGNNKHTYLNCNRSGTYKPKGGGKRLRYL